MTVPADTGPPDAAVEGLQPGFPVPAEAPAAPEAEKADERRGRELLGSARTRILAAYVILLAVWAVLSIVALRQVLIIRLEDQVRDALEQEMRELDRLVAEGRDPRTGRPFTSLQALFDVYLSRNVPSNDEAMIAFVGGEYYTSATARFPLDRLPAESLAEWEALSSPLPPPGGSAVGRFDSELGTGHFRATRVRLGDESGAFVVTILPAEELDEIGQLLRYGVIATVGALLLASACAWLITGRAFAPVRLLTETARSISKSDLTRRIDVRGTGEAAEMARSFNAMLDRLEAVFLRQRQFVQDAGHELRDPITICRGHLELLGDDPDERHVTISLVTDELDRMARIVDDMQVLADAEQPDFLRREWIDAPLFAHELLAKAGALDARTWALDYAPDGTFFADRQRLTEAVMNLAHNAVQHTDLGDTVALGASLTEDEARLWVRDMGSGIPVGDQPHIFDRFTRGSDAHLRYRGSGLGLAIVKAIAEAHEGRVDLESRLGEGSTFTIVVPRQPDGRTPWPGS